MWVAVKDEVCVPRSVVRTANSSYAHYQPLLGHGWTAWHPLDKRVTGINRFLSFLSSFLHPFFFIPGGNEEQMWPEPCASHVERSLI